MQLSTLRGFLAGKAKMATRGTSGTLYYSGSPVLPLSTFTSTSSPSVIPHVYPLSLIQTEDTSDVVDSIAVRRKRREKKKSGASSALEKIKQVING